MAVKLWEWCAASLIQKKMPSIIANAVGLRKSAYAVHGVGVGWHAHYLFKVCMQSKNEGCRKLVWVLTPKTPQELSICTKALGLNL